MATKDPKSEPGTKPNVSADEIRKMVEGGLRKHGEARGCSSSKLVTMLVCYR